MFYITLSAAERCFTHHGRSVKCNLCLLCYLSLNINGNNYNAKVTCDVAHTFIYASVTVDPGSVYVHRPTHSKIFGASRSVGVQ